MAEKQGEIVDRFTGTYPDNWQEIAWAVKCREGWQCERCGAEHGSIPNVLTVHHLDNDKSNCANWNLAALCQRCHLHVQALLSLDVAVSQLPLFIDESWLTWHLREYRKVVQNV